MRELETSQQQFREFLLRGRLASERAAPYCVHWIRRFLMRAASDEPLADQVRRFCEELERNDRCQEWQVRQAEQALRLYARLRSGDKFLPRLRPAVPGPARVRCHATHSCFPMNRAPHASVACRVVLRK